MFQKIEEISSVLLGLRKFMVMLMIVGIAVIFRIKGYFDGSQCSDLLKATAIAFMASNSFEHIKSAVTSWIDSKTGKKETETVTEVGDASDA